jgi:hypothetical protein
VSKKPIIGGIILAAIIGVVSVDAQINPDNPENETSLNSEVWSARIAGPEFDNIFNHRYSPIILERKVAYEFGFVPMGDSPERLKISVGGKGSGVEVFSELFVLEGTLIDTGISEYYTWDYTGNKNFEISYQQCPNQKTCNYDIIVKRYGNLKGSVTISLSR